ncbi:mitochondrial distribution and morphology protein 12 [Parastagonospora nodorum]|uniref:Mitochondrial distribution and morphology protein 12 n=1 Tax=Phaeosphaeria nodorum (strain SN15 / ATCC MYA-4574 / FGSC 10173) TaxID=321614 RepID=A0A7U2I4I7_PHANO|nr:mitochondrial distribution and morphology protein 12 [Parastagonospora nodorum]QRD03096.1 mitochondrial distribution and morphology protein 12 [Parastagonospora nodorum SN15]KAH3938191.1 mitochondrial distribution and morphology protein 12 [Parastagonospora nodorum]KAH3994235.1 mitochondrial distribution and morphology protein 12 [Parastagonospora nodorum]KAH4013567.1 mitochondrial distribution and morphology protein 12 [Parastagonospora nodorum]
MSIDINWDTLTGGADGAARAETIRAFIHDKFQQVTLPKFIRSVHVHSFDFGSASPEIEIKDICDPLPDFYEEDEDYPDNEDDDDDEAGLDSNPRNVSNSATEPSRERQPRETSRNASHAKEQTSSQSRLASSRVNSKPPTSRTFLAPNDQLTSPLLPRALTPGIPGGTSNINYFHLPLSAGLSGATTPLAAVAGAQLQGWLDNPYGRPSTPTNMRRLRHAASFNSLTLTPQSHPDPSSRPSSRHQHDDERRRSLAESDDASSQHGYDRTPSVSPHPMREKSPEDIQVVAHVQYSGDIKMSLTAEILLDYPMQSFVGIPLKLNITGLTFDGVALLAYIKRRAHFCFLSPDDAEALVGSDAGFNGLQTDSNGENAQPVQRPKIGGLLENIRVESEIGGQGSGKQVLKNVGKVESFVLEQVRRIFEDEFVYPSFWTFLV